jgi:mono/diheme cytochrome c family protein
MKSHTTALFAAAFALAACGDPSTNDHRGYTKAPLEHPNPLIRGENPGAVAQYGHPNRVVAEEIELAAEEAPAADAGPAVAVALPPGVTQEMVTQGKQLFTTGPCMACHGATAAGSALAPALNDAQWLNIKGEFDEIAALITTGVPKPKQFAGMMPPKGGGTFDDNQIKQLAAYVYSISRPAGGAAPH